MFLQARPRIHRVLGLSPHPFHTARRHSQCQLSYPSSLQHTIDKLSCHSQLSASQICQIVHESNITEADLLPWADFNHPPEDCYGRKMVYDGKYFEIMVMSWVPGDTSSIHDHGRTEWGAVKLFGAAEHGIFGIQDNKLYTTHRTQCSYGEVMEVGHDLVHQMGNPVANNERFISLHIYGRPVANGESGESEEMPVTALARNFDLDRGMVMYSNGGCFLHIPPDEIVKIGAGFEPDILTEWRHNVELLRRLNVMKEAGIDVYNDPKVDRDYDQLIRKVLQQYSTDETIAKMDSLVSHIDTYLDHNTHQNNDSVQWNIINTELNAVSALQDELLQHEDNCGDNFQLYASIYDDLIGKPCLDSFMAGYMQFVKDKYALNFEQQTLLSIGCGTGLMERYMIDNLGMNYDNVYGIDISAGMIQEAKKRINAQVANALHLDSELGGTKYDLVFSGLNVFQYLPHDCLGSVIGEAANVLKSGGLFFGDFITPDHIRWYPNVMFSNDKRIASLRTPKLIERDNRTYQASSITNIRLADVGNEESMLRVTYEGCHERYLPPLLRMRQLFEKHFDAFVHVYDAELCELIENDQDTTKSTRYIIVAKKK